MLCMCLSMHLANGPLDISTWKANRHLKLDMATAELLILAASLQFKCYSLSLSSFQEKEMYYTGSETKKLKVVRLKKVKRDIEITWAS